MKTPILAIALEAYFAGIASGMLLLGVILRVAA